jgi:hypothetical protein
VKKWLKDPDGQLILISSGRVIEHTSQLSSWAKPSPEIFVIMMKKKKL